MDLVSFLIPFFPSQLLSIRKDFERILGNMRKGAMAKIVKKCRTLYQSHIFICQTTGSRHLICQMEHPKGVVKPCMQCSRKKTR